MAEDYNRELELNGEKLADNIAERILSGFENKIGGLSEGIAKAGEKAAQKGVKELSQKLSQTEIKIGDNSFFINYDEKKISKQAINQIDKISKKINKYAEDAFNFPEKSKTLGSLQRTQGTLLPFDDNAIKLRTKSLTTKNIEQLLNKMDSDTKSKTEKIIGNIAQVLEFRDRAVAGLKDNKPSDIFDIRQVTMYADSLKDVIRSATVLSDLFKELENYGITSSSFSKRLKISGFQDEAQNFTKEFEDYKKRTTSSWLSMITGASTPEKGITEKKANQIINNHKLLLSAQKSDGNYIKVDDIRAEARAKVLSERANAIVEKYMQMAMDELESNLSDAFNKATNGKSNTDFVKLYNAYLARGGKQKEKYDEYNNSAAVQTNTLDYYVIEALRKKNEKPTSTPTDTIETTRKAAKQAESEATSTAGAIADQSEKTKQKVTNDAKQAADNAQKASQETKDKIADDQQATRDEYDKTKKKSDEVNNETQPTAPTESKKPTTKGTTKKTSTSKKGSSKKSTTKKSASDTSNDQNAVGSKPSASTEEIKNIENLNNAVKTVTQSVELKNEAFQLERRIVENAATSENEALLRLSDAIEAIIRNVKECDGVFEHLSEHNFDLKILSDEELQKFKNLSSELEGLNKVFENIGKLSTSDNIASKIDEIATSIGNLKDKFEGFPESGVNVFSELNSLAAHKDTLKDLAKVLSASSKQIEEAKKQVTNTPDPPARPANGKIIKSKVNNLNNSWEDTYIDDIGKLHVVGQKTNNNGVTRNIDHEVTSYKELETTAVRVLKKIIKTSEELKLAQMEINPDQGYIDSLINKQQTLHSIYKDILKVAKSYSDAEGSKYSLNNFFSSVKSKVTTDREDSRVRVAKKTPLIATKNEKKIVNPEDMSQLKSKINQLKTSMNASGADTTLLANQLDYLEKSLNNVSDTDAFNKIKSRFNTLSQQFRELNSSFKADQDVYSDQISVIDDLMAATTALNNTQANQMANPDKDFSETIRRQSEAVNELSVKAGEALGVVEDLFNAGGKISAEQVTDARNRLTAAASGSPESQENYNTAKVKSENKAYEDATDAIEKYKNAKSKLISLKADQLSNPEKDLSKSIKEATEDVKEFGNQAREAYLNVQELAKSSSTISSDMVSSLRNGLKDASKGSGAAQDKYTNAQAANEKKQIADNLKILKEYYDTWTKYNNLIAESNLDKDKDPKKYAAETLNLKMQLDRMTESVLNAYDAIQKLNSATDEDKALADQYLGTKGTFASQRKLNDSKNKKAALEDAESYKNNIKIIEEYWNKKAELINLNAKQMNAKNGEDYSDDIEKLTNALPGLEQKAKDAYDAIKKLINITSENKDNANKLFNEGNDNYQKARSNFGNAYNKSEFSKEKKALKDVSDAYEEYIKKRIELNNTVSKGVDDETFNIAIAAANDAVDQFKKTVDYAKSINVSDDSIHEVMSSIDTQYYSKITKSVSDIGAGYAKQIQSVEDKLKNASDNVKSIISDIKNQLKDALTLDDQGEPDYANINKFGQELKSKLDFAKELNNTENIIDKIAKNIEGGLGSSVGKVDKYSQTLKDFKTRIEEIYDSINKTPPKTGDDIQTINDQLNALNEEVTDFLKNKAGFKSVTGQGLLDTDSIGNVTNINDLSDALDKYVAAKKYAKLSAIDLNEATQTATVKIKDENDAVRVLTASIDANAKAMRVKTGNASSFGLFKDVIDGTGQYITMMLDVGDVINFVRRNISEAVSTFGEYDDALTNISYTMNMAQEDLENLGQSAIDMAEDLSMSIQDAASIYQIYANMNTTAAEIEKTAMPTAILSNLSGVDASTASDQVQGILQQFNMLEDESQNVADVSMHIVDVLDNISSNVAIDYANFIGTYIRNNI